MLIALKILVRKIDWKVMLWGEMPHAIFRCLGMLTQLSGHLLLSLEP